MANIRSKNTRSVPSKRDGRYRPPFVTPNPPQQPQRKGTLQVNANGKKRMI